MTLQEFEESAAAKNPPEGLSPELLSLWYDFKGDWHSAHDTAQDIHNAIGSGIHAYLHRKEGDLGNARYWCYVERPEAEISGSRCLKLGTKESGMRAIRRVPERATSTALL